MDNLKKKSQISNFMKICPVGDEFFHVDRQTGGWTDTTKLIVAFCSFVKAPKKDTGTFGTCFSVQGLMLS
jgi:hypothetical protein